jgi:predicted nuclease of predicted toxin-antitoxin system
VRILLDECLPARLKRLVPGHSVQTVSERGWRSVKDDVLLSLAVNVFDVFVTVDQRIAVQHDLTQFRLGFVIVSVVSNRIESFLPLEAQLNHAVERVRPGEVIRVG